jgi:hypothetical protein
MHGDQDDGRSVIVQRMPCIAAFCRQQMMRFIDHQPMRAPRSSSQSRNARKQIRKKLRPLPNVQALRIDHDIRSRLHQFQHLIGNRRHVDIAHRNGIFEIVIIAFGIEHAELKMSLYHSLDQGDGQRRLADNRFASNECVSPKRSEVHGLRIVRAEEEAGALAGASAHLSYK